MGPAESDLPVPFDKESEASPISNDELLSQLAGKEIERLLAEVDQQLDAAIDAAAREHPAPALALRRYPQLSPPRRLSVQEQGLARALEHFDDRADSPESELEPEHQELLGTPVEVFERVTGVQAEHHALATRDIDLFPDFPRSLPLALRPLAWINAPFDGISQTALSALGKVAIATFISAIGMLIYVLVITRAIPFSGWNF